jgi:putative transposase
VAAGDREDLRAPPDAQHLPLRSKADWYELARDLRPVYTAATEQAAVRRAESGDGCPAIAKLWQSAWAEFVPFLAYNAEIHQVIHS